MEILYFMMIHQFLADISSIYVLTYTEHRRRQTEGMPQFICCLCSWWWNKFTLELNWNSLTISFCWANNYKCDIIFLFISYSLCVEFPSFDFFDKHPDHVAVAISKYVNRCYFMLHMMISQICRANDVEFIDRTKDKKISQTFWTLHNFFLFCIALSMRW